MNLLVVDHENLIAHVIEQINGSFDLIQTACSGEEALEKMALTRYDLLITDITMPGISGLELI